MYLICTVVYNINTMASLPIPKQDNMLSAFKRIIKHKININLQKRFNIDTRLFIDLIFQNNLKQIFIKLLRYHKINKQH